MVAAVRTTALACLGSLSIALILALGSEARAEGPVKPLEIDTASGAHVFNVEWEMTDVEREKGLMNRRSMANDHGMLFDFRPLDEPVVFWMKDTYLPLDMIFIGADGRVVNVAHDAKPMDQTLIPSGAPTVGVLEVNAGVAKAIDLKIGDRVKHAMFGDVSTKP